MRSFSFSSRTAGDAFAIAKIVKPEMGDLCLRFDGSHLVVFSHDKRRYVRAVVDYETQPKDSRPEELFLTVDKTALFEAPDLDSVTVSFSDKSVTLKAEGGGQSRQASMKRKARKSRRPPIPPVPSLPSLLEERSDVLGRILGHLACSAQVKMKAEEEMRVNQVHFYPAVLRGDPGHVVSTTRHFMTVVRTKSFSVDLSVVGADVPSMRAFCERNASRSISLKQDSGFLYLFGEPTGSILALSRVASGKPPLELIDDARFSVSLTLNKEQLVRSVAWAALAAQEEGTSRVNLKVEGEGPSSQLVFRFGSDVVSTMDCSIDGGSFDSDFHIKYLAWILGYVDDKDGVVVLRFGSPDYPTILSVSPGTQDDSFDVHHYLQSMVRR